MPIKNIYAYTMGLKMCRSMRYTIHEKIQMPSVEMENDTQAIG